ncbi:MAG: rod shape-determining protein MreC [Phycisphaerae bacterium]|nr:rod shape-determining protein MreC [Phycisphaerae bacterium]
MRRYRLRTPSKQTVFLLLMGASLVMWWLPAELFGPARGMTQLVALPQWAAHQATTRVTEPLKALARQQMTAAEQRDLAEHKIALENENAVLRQRIEELKNTIEELALLRQDGAPLQGVIIPAPVIGLDAAPRRDSLVLGKGQIQGVRQEDWVASRLFVQAGREDGVEDDAAVLARECLIGRVEQIGALTSRVVLLSDPYANRAMRVHIAHFDPETRRPLHVTFDGRMAAFVLRGSGSGLMTVSDIHRDFVQAGVVTVGDLVTSDPHDAKLPRAMVIGEIIELRHNRDKPLLYDAVVRPRYDPKALSQVMVVDLSRAALDRQ